LKPRLFLITQSICTPFEVDSLLGPPFPSLSVRCDSFFDASRSCTTTVSSSPDVFLTNLPSVPPATSPFQALYQCLSGDAFSPLCSSYLTVFPLFPRPPPSCVLIETTVDVLPFSEFPPDLFLDWVSFCQPFVYVNRHSWLFPFPIADLVFSSFGHLVFSLNPAWALLLLRMQQFSGSLTSPRSPDCYVSLRLI